MAKLVRDKIPVILKAKGIAVETVKLNPTDFRRRLKDKLVEEAHEVRGATDLPQLTEELADTLEVLSALSQSHQIPMATIEALRLQKRKDKGGFEERVCQRVIDVRAGCPFCYPPDQRLVRSFTHCYAICDLYPVTDGHTLIIPYAHTENWFTASEEVRIDMMEALQTLKKDLDQKFQPDGYNIGLNCGASAGQTVMHLHLHLIPRYEGDTSHPQGGVRGVIPSKQSY